MSIQHALLVIAIMVYGNWCTWEYPCIVMLLTFKNLKSVQVTIGATSIVNMAERLGLKKHTECYCIEKIYAHYTHPDLLGFERSENMRI